MPIKLTSDNYAVWRAQFLNILYGYDLVGFVDGTIACPEQDPASQTVEATR